MTHKKTTHSLKYQSQEPHKVETSTNNTLSFCTNTSWKPHTSQEPYHLLSASSASSHTKVVPTTSPKMEPWWSHLAISHLPYSLVLLVSLGSLQAAWCDIAHANNHIIPQKYPDPDSRRGFVLHLFLIIWKIECDHTYSLIFYSHINETLTSLTHH